MVSRKSNRTDTGCAVNWPRLEPSANNVATSFRPTSAICKRYSTAGNVSYARRTNRNEPWSGSLRTRTEGYSHTSERWVLTAYNTQRAI